jgi:hypothetical protein
MSIEHTTDTDIDTLINDLYWLSDRTVEDIVLDCGVGRATLYNSIRPFAAGIACPTCSGRLTFTNRTNRASGNGICEDCGV